MLVKIVWPDGRIEEIEHAHAQHATIIEVPATADGADPDVVTSVQNSGQPMHRFRRILVGNVDTGHIHTLWVHADTDVHVVKRVVDWVARDAKPDG
jgi:hypothetical protein